MPITQEQRIKAINMLRSSMGDSSNEDLVVDSITGSGVSYKNIKPKQIEDEKKRAIEEENFKKQKEFQINSSYKDEINKLQKMTLQEKRIAELFNEVKDAPIGPWKASLFDTQIPNFNESGKLKEPSGIIDYLITKMAPEKTKKLATLASNLSDAQKIAFDIGGKTVSGTEAPITFGSFPTIYQEPDTFNNILNEYKKDLLRDKNEQLKYLKNVGVSDSILRQYMQSQGQENSISPDDIKNRLNEINKILGQ